MRHRPSPAPEFADPAAAKRWLSRRGGEQDLAVEELRSPIDFLQSIKDGPFLDALALLPGIVWDFRRRRGQRTTRHRIGLWMVDGLGLAARQEMLHPVLLRLAVGLPAAALVFWLGGVSPLTVPSAVLIALAVCVFTQREQRPAVVLAALAVLAYLPLWWLDVLALWAVMLVIASWDMVKMMANPWWARGRSFGFIPWRVRVTLRLRRQWAPFTTAVDLACHGRSDTVAPFVAAVRKRPVPAVCEPVLLMVHALDQLRLEDPAGALLTAREAAGASGSMPDGVRGWCLAELSRVYTANGDSGETAAASAEARLLLRGRGCRTHRRRLALERGEREMESLPLHEALRTLHRRRRQALRCRDERLLTVTELWLAQLTARVGNVEGTRHALRCAHSDDARSQFLVRPEEAARVRLMAASALVDEERTRDHARQDALAALALVDARTRPLAAVAARQVLSRAEELDGRPEAAMAQAAHGLVAVHEARYRVGTAQGRRLWERMQLGAYATALRLAERQEGDTGALVAEVVETARGEVLPRRIDEMELDRHQALLDATRAPRTSGSGGTAQRSEDARPTLPREAALAAIGLSPVRRPPPIRVAGSRRLPRQQASSGDTRPEGEAAVEEPVFDLDRALFAVAGRCWYWSAVTVEDRYYWTVRSPSGEWSHGWRPLGPGSDAALADAALRDALPLARAGEGPDGLRTRVTTGALSQKAGTGAELALLGRVSKAFLPESLAKGLAGQDASEVASLVVALPAVLGHVPVAALPLIPGRDLRVVDVARVIHVPGWAVIEQCLSRPAGPAGVPGELRLAVLRPDAVGAEEGGEAEEGGQGEGLAAPGTALNAPGPARCVLRGPVTKARFSQVLRELDALYERDGLLYLLGHVGAAQGNPYIRGLRVAPTPGDGTPPGDTAMLSMADMLQDGGGGDGGDDGGSGGGSGEPGYPMPRQVLAVGCTSLGLDASAQDEAHTPVSEWLGFGSALLLSGADHVICTVYPVLHPSAQLEAVAKLLTRRLCEGVSPPDALRETQLAHLRRWRAGGPGRSFVWQAFAYTGVGF